MESAATQAAQSAVMSVRFLVSVAMAVAERTGREDPARAAQVDRLRQLAQADQDPSTRYAQMVREEFATPAIRDALLNSEQWPQIAKDLAHLESAGIDPARVPAGRREHRRPHRGRGGTAAQPPNRWCTRTWADGSLTPS